MSSNYGWGLPVAASSFAKDVDRGIILLHISMITIFAVWAIVFAVLLIKYRARPGHHVQRDGMSLKWLYIPLVLIFADEVYMISSHAIPTWNRIKARFPPADKSNVVEVVAEQYAWNIHYPGRDGKFGRRDARFIDSANTFGLDPDDPAGKDDVVSQNEMHLPLGMPTLARLSSKDVIHSFFIPEFRVKQDATPGMKIPVWFEPTLAGTFEIACAQLCGIGHTMMRGDVIVESRDKFEAWLKSQARGKG